MSISPSRVLKNIQIYKNIDLEGLCCICDPKILSNNFEKLALSTVEDDDYIAFTYEKEGIVYSIAIFNLEVTHDMENVRAAELIMLCSNYEYRVKGITRQLLNAAIRYIKHYHPDITTILVQVADNANTVKFYTTFGFKLFFKNLYYLPLYYTEL